MTITASEAKNKFGVYLDEAQTAPVIVKKNNRARGVIMSYENYQRLSALEDGYWIQRAEEAKKSGYMGEEALERLQQGLQDSKE